MRIKHVRIGQTSGRLYGDVERERKDGSESRFQVSLPLNRPDVETHMEALRRLLLLEAERQVDEFAAEMVSEDAAPTPKVQHRRQRPRPPRGQPDQLARPA